MKGFKKLFAQRRIQAGTRPFPGGSGDGRYRPAPWRVWGSKKETSEEEKEQEKK